MTCKDNRIINNNQESHSYEASLIINFIIHKLLERDTERISFESVMSHPSKLDILKKAKERGYKNYLYYISTEDASINIARVENRVRTGGHNVSPDKIISRYTRSLDLLTDAVKLTHRTYIWDNSKSEAEYILNIEPDKPENNTHFQTTDEIPIWVQTYLIEKFS